MAARRQGPALTRTGRRWALAPLLLLLLPLSGARAAPLEAPTVWQPQLRGFLEQQPLPAVPPPLVWQPKLQGFPMLVPPPAAGGRPGLPGVGSSPADAAEQAVEEAQVAAIELSRQPCAAPYASVDENTAACVAAAEALRSELPCRMAAHPLLKWAERVAEVDKPLWPRGCFVREGSQGDCELIFNPTGSMQESHTGPGPRHSVAILCQAKASLALVV